MATTEDEKPETSEDEKKADETPAEAEEHPAHEHEHDAAPEHHEDHGAPPGQLGYRRFVYAAYFAGAIGVAFLFSKLIAYAWTRLNAWKPSLGLGEPKDEMVMPIAAVLGVVTALYYWRRTRARKLAEEVASELSKVTWPSRKEVTNSTAVVIIATLVSTIFFALMDRFWGFLTDKVYSM